MGPGVFFPLQIQTLPTFWAERILTLIIFVLGISLDTKFSDFQTGPGPSLGPAWAGSGPGRGGPGLGLGWTGLGPGWACVFHVSPTNEEAANVFSTVDSGSYIFVAWHQVSRPLSCIFQSRC